jgi:hypothetical protein
MQLSEWEAYDRIDPIGTWREDFRMAYLCSLVTNLVISVHGKKGAKTTNVIDFMPEWGKHEEDKVIESGKSLAEQIKEVFGSIAKKNKQKEELSKRPPVKREKR